MTQPVPFILTRLSVLLFVQFFVWGAWYLTAFRYMIAHDMGYNAFYLYTAGPIAAILTPFIMGLCVDRFFNTERVLAVCFLCGGAIMLCLPWIGSQPGTAVMQANPATGAQEVAWYTTQVLGFTMVKSTVFNLAILVHMLFFMPTLGLTATLSFRHLPKGNEQFPLVRMWGTFGWIAAGLVLAFGFTAQGADGRLIEAGELPVQFQIGGVAAIALGLYCLTMPATPAGKRGQPFDWREMFFIDAWKELRTPAFATYTLCSFLVCIPLAAYYMLLSSQLGAMNLDHASVWANVGTWLEAGMMFLMPLFIRRLGIKRMIAIGIAAWVARYALFSWSAGGGVLPDPFLAGGAVNPAYPGVVIGGLPIPAMHLGFLCMLVGVALHGFCYDFFFVTGQVFVDKVTRPEIRGQSQAMNIFFTQGVGMYVGALVANHLANAAFADANGHAIVASTPAALPHWPQMWWPLAGMAAVALVVFWFAFRYREPEKA